MTTLLGMKFLNSSTVFMSIFNLDQKKSVEPMMKVMAKIKSMKQMKIGL
jgi:hypothetical protein